MDTTNTYFFSYLAEAKDFARCNQVLDSVVYTLFQDIEEGVAAKKRKTYWMKNLLFVFFVFYKYYFPQFGFRGRQIPSSAGCDILVVIHGPGPQHYGELILVIEELLRRGQQLLVIAGTITAKQRDYLNTRKGIVLMQQDELAFKIPVHKFVATIIESYSLRKKLITDVVNNGRLYRLFKGYRGFLLDSFFVSTCHYKAAVSVMTKNTIKLVLSSSDGNLYSRGYFIHANREHIESIITQHGFIQFLHTKAVASKIVLWSKGDVEYFHKNGVPDERILPLGLPRFDAIAGEVVRTEHCLNSKFGLGEDVKKICFAFPLHAWSYDPVYYQAYWEQIRFVTESLTPRGIKIFIRAHPNDSIAAFNDKIISEIVSDVTLLPTDFPLIQLIKQVDLYIADFSTSLIESMLCGIATVFFNHDSYWTKKSTMNCTLQGCIIEETDTARLLPKIERILFDFDYRTSYIGGQNAYINESLLNVGAATRSIADYIQDVVQKECK